MDEKPNKAKAATLQRYSGRGIDKRHAMHFILANKWADGNRFHSESCRGISMSMQKRYKSCGRSFYYAWAIPYVLFLVIFLALYLKFLFKLPKTFIVSFIFPDRIFILGAIAFEAPGGWKAELYGNKGLLHSIHVKSFLGSLV